jgi:hypothetical protein
MGRAGSGGIQDGWHGADWVELTCPPPPTAGDSSVVPSEHRRISVAVPTDLLPFDLPDAKGGGPEQPLTSEPALVEDAPLTSEPPLPAEPALTSEPVASVTTVASLGPMEI